MPIPAPVLYPPFNIVRLSHTVFNVTDLAAMRGLAGGKAGFITGACIPVDGGYSIA